MVTEFVEGFANDLLEDMRSMSDVEVGMVIEDFVVEGRISSLVCDIIIPIAPLEPYSFQFQLWCNQAIDDMPPEMEGCGSQNGGWWCEPKWLPVSHSCHRR
jgi:hypothetical protein